MSQAREKRKREEEWTIYTGGEDYRDRLDVHRVRVAPNVASIGDEAFLRCADLREVDLCNARTIGARAFCHCWKLKAVHNFDGVSSIGRAAFAGCDALHDEEEIIFPWTVYAGTEDFAGDIDIRRIRVDPTITSVGDDAFSRCQELREVDLCNVTSIGMRSFYDCWNLRAVNCSKVATIGNDAFEGCQSLKMLNLPDGLETIGECACRGTGLRHLTIPSTVSDIRKGTFASCRDMNTVDFRTGLKTIGFVAFGYCNSLRSIIIPSSVEEIGGNAFRFCQRLRSVELTGEGIQIFSQQTLTDGNIVCDAFQDCPLLRSISIPSPSFVISSGAYETLECHLWRGPLIAPTYLRMIVSKCVKHMSPNHLAEAEGRINGILGQNQTVEEKLRRIRMLFTYYEILLATAHLELGIWKMSIDGTVDNNNDAKQECRRSRRCGQDMNVIIPGVVQFLRSANGDSR